MKYARVCMSPHVRFLYFIIRISGYTTETAETRARHTLYVVKKKWFMCCSSRASTSQYKRYDADEYEARARTIGYATLEKKFI